jgi:hypothetical protein
LRGCTDNFERGAFGTGNISSKPLTPSALRADFEKKFRKKKSTAGRTLLAHLVVMCPSY